MKVNLNTMQRLFLSYLLNPEQQKEQMQKLIKDAGQESATQRLQIYSQSYRLRLEEALQDNYPALHTLCGDDEFHRLCLLYIEKNPSHHFSIRYFGHKLSAFVSDSDKFEHKAVLAEMAEFEWTLREVFDADSDSILDENSLMQVTAEKWPDLKLLPSGTLRILNLSWNVPQLWKIIDENQSAQAPVKSTYPITWILWRKDLQSYFRSLDVDEAWSLSTMLEGGTFGDVCTGLTEWIDEPNVPIRAAGFIKKWVQDELISQYTI